MGKELIINKLYKVKEGALKGQMGVLIAYDAIEDRAVLRPDEKCTIVTFSGNLELVTSAPKEY